MSQKKNENVPTNKVPSSDVVLEMEKTIKKNPEILDQLFESPLIQQTVIHKVESYKGPLPHPDILKKYDEIDPSFSNDNLSTFRKRTESST